MIGVDLDLDCNLRVTERRGETVKSGRPAASHPEGVQIPPEALRLAEAMRLVARATDEVGAAAFPAQLMALLQFGGAYDSAAGFLFATDGRPPLRLFDNLSEEEAAISIAPYLAREHHHDPMISALRHGAWDGVVQLTDCVDAGFQHSRYYREYYRWTRLCDECGLFVRLGDEHVLVISVGNRSDRPEACGDVSLLKLLMPCVRALCRKHWSLCPPVPAPPAAVLDEEALSPREAQIHSLILKGLTGKEIANHLHLSPDTVKVYRKRLHRKLKVSSARAMFCRALEGARQQ